MSPLVERVTNSFPHVQRTVASTYSGWISVFMASISVVGSSTEGGERVVGLVGLVHRRAGVGDGRDLLPRRARGGREEDAVLLAGFQARHGHRAQQPPVQRDVDVERARV